MLPILRFLSARSRAQIVVCVMAITGIVAVADFISGYELSFSFFYLSAIAMAVWFVGKRFAWVIAVASVVFELAGDLLAGARAKLLLAGWNAALALGFYLVTIQMLAALRALQASLERKVQHRTAALAAEMKTRELAESEILAVSEREQRRIGHDLHDTLCQHLTATAIAGEVLRGKLSAAGGVGVSEAAQLVMLVEESIDMARSTARGLAPIEFEPDGLMEALGELASRVRERFRLRCIFHCPIPIPVRDSNAAVHLFRIAQEAVTNATRHAHATSLTITLERAPEGGIRLAIEDDGLGIPRIPGESRGMGVQIMKHRAKMIGAYWAIHPLKLGTRVECVLPPAPALGTDL